jgi:hypothetical protein
VKQKIKHPIIKYKINEKTTKQNGGDKTAREAKDAKDISCKREINQNNNE